MANEKNEKGPAPQGSEDQKGKNGFAFGLLAFFVAMAIMLSVIGGAFYFVIHNNINGLGERYRKDLQGVPILKWALPKLPAKEDPEDPKYLTAEQIKNGYNNLRKLRDELKKQIEDANKKIAELQKIKDNQDKANADVDKAKQDIEAQKAQLEKDKAQLAEDKKKIDELIAKGDIQGFKAYFEKVDPETAKKIYSEIMTNQKAGAEALKFAQFYESMDPSAAAKIFEQMGSSKIDLIISILKNMKKSVTSQVIAAMSPAFAAKVTEKMSAVYGISGG